MFQWWRQALCWWLPRNNFCLWSSASLRWCRCCQSFQDSTQGARRRLDQYYHYASRERKAVVRPIKRQLCKVNPVRVSKRSKSQEKTVRCEVQRLDGQMCCLSWWLIPHLRIRRWKALHMEYNSRRTSTSQKLSVQTPWLGLRLSMESTLQHVRNKWLWPTLPSPGLCPLEIRWRPCIHSLKRRRNLDAFKERWRVVRTKKAWAITRLIQWCWFSPEGWLT